MELLLHAVLTGRRQCLCSTAAFFAGENEAVSPASGNNKAIPTLEQPVAFSVSVHLANRRTERKARTLQHNIDQMERKSIGSSPIPGRSISLVP